jgi:hypothetical protein
MHGFGEHKRPRVKPNKVYPFVIVVNITGYNMAKALIDEGSSCNIMYDDLFAKLEMNSSNFSRHWGINLHGFDESVTYP